MTTSDTRTAVPQRTCVGCRRQRPQSALVRCALSARGATDSRTAAGRGAWLCSYECFTTAERRRSFDRAWKASVPKREVRDLEAQVPVAFDDVIINMEESPSVGVATDGPAATKG